MDKQLQEFARDKIKGGLAQCSPEQQRVFRLMYSSDNLQASISDIVDNMSEDTLDWAMQQIQRTLDKQVIK